MEPVASFWVGLGYDRLRSGGYWLVCDLLFVVVVAAAIYIQLLALLFLPLLPMRPPVLPPVTVAAEALFCGNACSALNSQLAHTHTHMVDTYTWMCVFAIFYVRACVCMWLSTIAFIHCQFATAAKRQWSHTKNALQMLFLFFCSFFVFFVITLIFFHLFLYIL